MMVMSRDGEEYGVPSEVDSGNFYDTLTVEQMGRLTALKGAVATITPVKVKVAVEGSKYDQREVEIGKKYSFPDGTYAILKDSPQGGYLIVNPGTALKALQSKEGTPQEDAYEYWQHPNTGVMSLRNKITKEYKLGPDGKPVVIAEAPEGWIPGYGVQAPSRATPKTADDIAYTQARTENERLDALKKQRELQNQQLLAWQEEEELIETLRADKSKSIEEKTRILDLFNQNREARLLGTTPFEIQKEGTKRQDAFTKQKLDLASGIVSDRASKGSSLAQGLMTGLTGAFGKVYSSTNPRYDYNVFDWARSYMDQEYDPELSEMAKAVLRGSMGGGQ